MLDSTDFIVVNENNKVRRKLYRMYCDNCYIDRGYQRKIRQNNKFCRECAGVYTHKNKIVSVLTKQKMSNNSWIGNRRGHPMSGKTHRDSTKIKLSKAATLQNRKYRGKYQYVGAKGIIGMRSSWEVKYARYLDMLNIKWIYEPEFKLSNGKIYTPDFKLEDGTIVEIKGYFRPDAKEKWNLFTQDYPKLKKKLLMRSDLKQIRVI